MALRLSALHAGPAVIYPPGRFLVLISVKGWVDPRAIVRLEGLGQLKKSNDFIGIRIRDLPACSIVPQPSYATAYPIIYPINSNYWMLTFYGFSYFIISLRHNGWNVSHKRNPCYPFWVTEIPFSTVLFLFGSSLRGFGGSLCTFSRSWCPWTQTVYCCVWTELKNAFKHPKLCSYGDTNSLYQAQYHLWLSLL
jgi:hypothetical protein